MSYKERLRPIIKILKITSVFGIGGYLVTYQIRKTYMYIDKIINTNVLDREKKYVPEYIYIDDPSYNVILEKAKQKDSIRAIGFTRIWKSLKHSLAWRLLWLCRHGNKEQRNVALEQLAAFKNNKDWDCLKLAQAMDKDTAVLLARTRGADLRYFLVPPLHIRKAALTSELLSYKFKDIILSVQNLNPHSCIQHFLSKYFTNLQEQVTEADSIPAKPDSISERDMCVLCLDALHHHISIFHNKNYSEDQSAALLIKLGLLPKLVELFLRYPNDAELDLAILRILTVLSVYCNLLNDFFYNGLIRELARLLRSSDVRLSSSAAVCLSNLSGDYCYRPGLYLLHPLYRTNTSHSCDILLVHGLRGGVFVTWRQRDRKYTQPLGIIDGVVSEVGVQKLDSCEESSTDNKYIDPELQQVMDDLIEIEDEALLSDLEVVLHDLPIDTKRENNAHHFHTASNKRLALMQEDHDRCNYSFCWPKDWLPKDCSNLRILGINYWSSLSEWLERCPLQSADIAYRASELAPTLIDAKVGDKNIPIVWLAHSMGGLIVKQLLVDSAQHDNDTNKSLCNNTKAVIFYSTPHRGSALANMPRAAAAVLWPSNDVRQLQENAPILLEIHKKFITYVDHYNWETISFAESKPTLISTFKVPVNFVEANSADLGRGSFYKLPLDHLNICKPATRQSMLYTTVLEVLQRVTAKDLELNYSNKYLQWLWYIICWITKKNIIERDDELETNDRLRWFEQILLDTFTDGFTD